MPQLFPPILRLLNSLQRRSASNPLAEQHPVAPGDALLAPLPFQTPSPGTADRGFTGTVERDTVFWDRELPGFGRYTLTRA